MVFKKFLKQPQRQTYCFVLFGQNEFDFKEYCHLNNKRIVDEINIDSLEVVLIQKINTFRKWNENF